MPVRIYEISKKLGLENKEVLTAAKALGIAAAKVPSSSLDKITAEYLEEEILKTHPALAAKLKPAALAPEPKPVHVEQKIEIIKAPEPPPVIIAPEPASSPPCAKAPAKRFLLLVSLTYPLNLQQIKQPTSTARLPRAPAS